jgi:hypothetical protein
MPDLMPYLSVLALASAASIALFSRRNGKWQFATFLAAYGCYAADIAQPINHRVGFYVAFGVLGFLECLHHALQLR